MATDLFSSLDTPSAELPTHLMVQEAPGTYRPAQETEVLRAAQRLLLAQLRTGAVMDSPAVVKDFLRTKIGTLQHEVFAVIHMDAQHRLIAYVEMFRGTITQTSVYPREVVKEALNHNSAAVLLVHNHPSGAADPSTADRVLTDTLKAALALVDVRVLDHMIVTPALVASMAELGLV